MSDVDSSARALVETWAIGARITRYLLDGIPAAALDARRAAKGARSGTCLPTYTTYGCCG